MCCRSSVASGAGGHWECTVRTLMVDHLSLRGHVFRSPVNMLNLLFENYQDMSVQDHQPYTFVGCQSRSF